jgi:hypothetical protein
VPARLDDGLIAYHDRVAILKARGALDEAHAKPGEACLRIVGLDRCNDAVNVLVHAGKIDREIAHRKAERLRPCDRMGVPGGGDE